MTSACRQAYDRWEQSYRSYAKARGFESFNDGRYHWRGFVAAWAQPGFHKFWQVWNPGIAYFMYRLYRRLGGRDRRAAATLITFVACGLVHNLVVLPFLGWSYTLVVAFACCGLLTILSRMAAPLFRQERWPVVVNVAINVLLVIGSFDVGFRVDRIL